LRGLPVVSIRDGVEIGSISSFLIDYDAGKMEAFVLTASKPGVGIRVVPIANVNSFGTFAITLLSADSVVNLPDNPRLMSLFEKDIQFLGSKVYQDGSDRVVGFVKDVSVNLEDGAVLLVTITNDAGFTSPYRASIPYSSVKDVERDSVILEAEYKIGFKREGPLGRAEESGAFVPLVIEDERWRQFLGERIKDEAEQIGKRLRDSLFADHQQYFLSNEKERMSVDIGAELDGKIERFFEEKFSEVERAFRELLLETAGRLVTESSLIESAEKLRGESAVFEKALKEAVETELAARRAEAEAFTNKIAGAVDELKSEMTSKIGSEISILEKRMKEFFGGELEKADRGLSLKLDELAEKTETKLLSASASLQELENKIAAAMEKTEAAVRENSKTEAERAAEQAAASLKQELESKIILIKDEATSEIAAMKQETATAVDEIKSKTDSLDQNIGGLSNRQHDAEILMGELRQAVAARIDEIKIEMVRELTNAKKSVETAFSELAVKYVSREDSAAAIADIKKELSDSVDQLKKSTELSAGAVKEQAEAASKILEDKISHSAESLRGEMASRSAEREKRYSEKMESVESSLRKDFSDLRNEAVAMKEQAEAASKILEEKISQSAESLRGEMESGSAEREKKYSEKMESVESSLRKDFSDLRNEAISVKEQAEAASKILEEKISQS
ncbi:MAG TPA: PRC-barrel domain-containing protein, partial [bacterium]|nr:PRC-barrel domain-containing protein [bacterium]